MDFWRCLFGVHRYRVVKSIDVFANDTDKRAVAVVLVQCCRSCGRIISRPIRF